MKVFTMAALGLAALVASPATSIPASAQAAGSGSIAGGATLVRLTAAPTLVGLGLSIRATGRAFLGGNRQPVATFLITGGIQSPTGSAILHDGSGLVFSAGKKRLAVSNFVVNTSTSFVLADVNANGTKIEKVTLFKIGRNLELTLTKEGAGAFTGVFGAPDLTGAVIGRARTVPALDINPGGSGAH